MSDKLGSAVGQYKASTAPSGTTPLYVTDASGNRRWARAIRAVEAGTFKVRSRGSAPSGKESESHPDHVPGSIPKHHQIVCVELMAAGDVFEIEHDVILATGDNTDYGTGTVVTTASKKFESYW